MVTLHVMQFGKMSRLCIFSYGSYGDIRIFYKTASTILPQFDWCELVTWGTDRTYIWSE